MNRNLIPALIIFLVLLAACGSRAPAPTVPAPTSTPAPVATDTPIPPTAPPPAATPTPPTADAPAATPAAQVESPLTEPTLVPTPVDWSEVETRTAEGYYERGNPAAPILILDYSDFL